MDDGGFSSFFGYIRGDSTAGFIYSCHGEQLFFQLWAEAAESPAFLPRNCTVCDSSFGLLLCSNPTPFQVPNLLRIRRYRVRRYGARRNASRSLCRPFLCRYAYLVCNPFFRDYRRYVRKPPSGLRPHHRTRIPRALVVYPHPTHPGFVFYIVCALPNTTARCYSFEVFSSDTNHWRTFRPHSLGRIRDDTGVSCGTAAYWLLHDLPLAVYYDTSNDAVGAVDLPDAYAALFAQPGVCFRSQLGKIGDNLCFVVATEEWRAAYIDMVENYAGDDKAGVVELLCCRERRYAFRQVPMLSRFQDGRLQVPFWYDNGSLTVWDARRGGVEPVRTVCLEGPQRDLGADILPLVHTVLHPVMHFIRGTEWNG